ncbi:acyl-CoA synthetase [Mycobacterium tuberculosis]|nr:acyl-CoA synthetase [Mycobacterium tuberculosis]
MRPARTLAKKGNIPVGYYKDEKKTAETFRTINGVRYAIPGDYAQVEEDGTVTMLGVARCRSTAAARRSTPKRSRPL